MLTVLKRELRSLFKSIVPYVFGAVILLVVGVNTYTYCVQGTLSNFEYAISASAWIFLLLVPLSALWMSKRLRLPVEAAASETGAGADTKDDTKADARDDAKNDTKDDADSASKKTVGARGLFSYSEADKADAAFYASEGISDRLRVLGVYLASLVMLLLPLIVLILYPLILSIYGTVYMPTCLFELLGFFFLGAALEGFALIFASTQKKALFALLFTALAVILSYLVSDLATYCTSAYSGMLFFTLLIGLIAAFIYLTSKNGNLTLLVAAVLEILQVLFFVLKQDSFESLAPRVLSKLSLFDRFGVFTGGLLDLRALIYFAAVAFTLTALSLAAYGYEPPIKQEPEDENEIPASSKEKEPAFGGFPIVMPAVSFAAALIITLACHLFTGTALLMDVSGTGLFTPGERLEQAMKDTDKPVDIYWIVQNNMEDASVYSALTYYDAMSRNVRVIRCNPDVQSDFITQYVIESVYNNSLLYKCGDLVRYTEFSDLYGYDNSRYKSVYDLVLKIEDETDHALEYFSGTEARKVYYTTGHEEVEIPAYFVSVLQRHDISADTLADVTAIPEDASALIINAPVNDFTEEEADALYEYLQNGGDLFLMTRVQETTPGDDGSLHTPHLNNLESIMVEYGAAQMPGLVLESTKTALDSQHPYLLQPNVCEHDATSLVISSRTAPMLSYSHGLILSELSGVTAMPLLLTSENSCSKVDGTMITTWEPEEGDFVGSIPVAAAFEKGDTHVVWVGSHSLLMEEVSDRSSGGNRNFLIGTLNYLTGGQLHEPIPGTLYNYGTLYTTNDELVSSRLTMLLCFVFPFLYLLTGLILLFVKLYKKNQAAQAEAERLQREADERQAAEEAERQAKREAYRKQKEEATRAAIEAARKKKENKE